MAINKIRHGQEITSDKLNEIIETLNEFLDTVSVYRTQSKELEEVHDNILKDLNTLQNDSNSKFETLPYLSQLIETFIYAKTSGVQWSFKDDKNNIASKTTFFMGPYEQFPTDLVDKRILFDTTNNAIWVDHLTSDGTFSRKMWALAPTTSEEKPVIVTASVPKINIVLDNETNKYVWQITNPDKTVHTYDGSDGDHPYIQVEGLQGLRGPQGVEGPRGLQGDTGPQGPQGLQGPKGNDGSNIILDFLYADDASGYNSSKDYNGQKWLGYKTYYSTDDEATIQAKQYQYIRILGDTLYPFVENGLLKFSTNPPANAASGLDIRGPKGDVGPAGATPTLIFKNQNENTYIVPDSRQENNDGSVNLYYNSADFKGPKGDTVTIENITFDVNTENNTAIPTFHLSDGSAITQNTNLKGPAGPAPTLIAIARTVSSDEVADVISEAQGSNTYRLTFSIPQGAKGDKGDSIENIYIDSQGYIHIKTSGKTEEL
jgi:hypothetical protein